MAFVKLDLEILASDLRLKGLIEFSGKQQIKLKAQR